jgi:hypothetical protein
MIAAKNLRIYSGMTMPIRDSHLVPKALPFTVVCMTSLGWACGFT